MGNKGDQRYDVLTSTSKVAPTLQPAGKVLASVSLKSLFSSVVLDALQGPWSPNLYHSLVCQPLVRELSDCTKRSSGVETSSLNLGTCKNLSPPRCLFQFLAPTQDFKLCLY